MAAARYDRKKYRTMGMPNEARVDKWKTQVISRCFGSGEKSSNDSRYQCINAILRLHKRSSMYAEITAFAGRNVAGLI